MSTVDELMCLTHWYNNNGGGGSEALGTRPLAVSLCSPQIPYLVRGSDYLSVVCFGPMDSMTDKERTALVER
jgi:hypothetical protein